jgi:hypothetical protein
MTDEPANTDEVVAPFSIDLGTGEVRWSPPIYQLYGLCPDTDRPSLEALLAGVVPADRDRVRQEFTAGVLEGGAFCIRYRVRDGAGMPHEIQLAAVGSRLNGVTTYITGFLLDVTVPLTARLDAAVAASAEHRAAIEQAKGALMLGHALTEQEAFAVLRTFSNQHNVKLSVLAAKVVKALNDAAHGKPGAAQSVMAVMADLADTVKRDRATASATHSVSVTVRPSTGRRARPMRA